METYLQLKLYYSCIVGSNSTLYGKNARLAMFSACVFFEPSWAARVPATCKIQGYDFGIKGGKIRR